MAEALKKNGINDFPLLLEEAPLHPLGKKAELDKGKVELEVGNTLTGHMRKEDLLKGLQPTNTCFCHTHSHELVVRQTFHIHGAHPIRVLGKHEVLEYRIGVVETYPDPLGGQALRGCVEPLAGTVSKYPYLIEKA